MENELRPELAEASQETLVEQFSCGECIEQMAARFHYGIISRNEATATFTIARPEVFSFTSENNKTFTYEIYNFLREYYYKKGYQIEKNSFQKRFEIHKDGIPQAYIGMHHYDDRTDLWWYRS